ncbi:MAG: GNAT family N-acetyltransferase [Promethearchaeota archaeon]|nr:MAG: GNAT family N-acetyltransferase [Candidatus Lokiarchaeota archaeon]
MKVYFRELTTEDIPAINEISKDMWGGDDYIPDVIERWLKDDDCLNYGGFADNEKTDMVGFGRVKYLSNGIAWLEGGRVKSSEQNKGIGRELMRYAIERARDYGSKFAQYDTASDNEGSIALAKYFGFQKKKTVECVVCESKDLKMLDEQIAPLELLQLKAENARKEYQKYDTGPGKEVNIGWSFISFELLKDQGSSWYSFKNAILQKRSFTSQEIGEKPNAKEIWLITYGDPADCSLLIKNVVLSELEVKNAKYFAVFCTPEVVEVIKDYGFSYWENKPLQVVLFEKELKLL